MSPETVKLLVLVLGSLFVGAGGAGSYFVSRGESECTAKLADRSARLELTDKAMTACEHALDLCSGKAP